MNVQVGKCFYVCLKMEQFASLIASEISFELLCLLNTYIDQNSDLNLFEIIQIYEELKKLLGVE